jgi:SAM-dependent methyltransferase
MTDTDVQRIADAYDAVYAAIADSAGFARIWREHALGPDYPAGFEHISFLTPDEMRQLASALALRPGDTLADLACGMGGPGLWIARESGAQVAGIDASAVGVEHARKRAAAHGMQADAMYATGTFAATGLDSASADAIMSVDALQYAPGKRDALREMARILKPGGRLAVACFEVDPAKVAGLPIWGTDPVADYVPLLSDAGFEMTSYTETPGWYERVTATYQAIVDAGDELASEMGTQAYATLRGECALTLELGPYPRRVLFTAIRR